MKFIRILKRCLYRNAVCLPFKIDNVMDRLALAV